MTNIKELFIRSRPIHTEVQPYKAKPLIVNGITLITEERMREIHEEALVNADRITEEKIKTGGGNLWWVGFAVECLVTGGKPTALYPRERK